MIKRSKLARLRRFAANASRSPLQAKLDRLWGFDPKPIKSRRRASKNGPHRKNESLDAKSKVEKAFASLDAVEDSTDVEQKAQEAPTSTKEREEHRKPWEPDPEVEEQRKLFKQTVKELHSFVYPHLDPIAKRQYDNAKLVALGGKVAHNRKMPYSEFMQRSKALKRNVEKNKELEKQLGVKLFKDTKGGARFAEIEKRKRKREFNKSRPLLDYGDKSGVYYIKNKKKR
ncbi:hypothetical protein BgAZ_403250 [Babesia gibsoni]|uniref:Uncharacterized protein n=1 Tax=Babesia gibsoni TaxID=33632 RepID=A0AAD8LGP3_BABGI|nr:hypothetical protein BgAZ_403250 [Babesia gibsoni]